jgi:hypothetical protein
MVVDGIERKFHFGMNCWIEYCTLRNITINEMGEELQRIGKGGGTGAEMRDLLWASLKCGALKHKQDFDLTNYDVGFIMDDMTFDELNLFFKEMNDSLASTLPSDNGEENKKKVST